MAIINREIQQDVERALALLLPYDLRSVLREMAMRNPQDFLQIVRAMPLPSEPLQNRNVPGTERIYRTLNELQLNPDLKRKSEDAATKCLDGNMIIPAIKVVREISGLCLKDAKDFVESLPAYATLRMRRGYI